MINVFFWRLLQDYSRRKNHVQNYKVFCYEHVGDNRKPWQYVVLRYQFLAINTLRTCCSGSQHVSLVWFAATVNACLLTLSIYLFRGRYSIRVYPTFLQLHGKTYDYKIPHTTVLRLFLLPHQDNRFMFFVVSATT